MNEVTIDENHVYHTADGRVVPGVTGIIRSAGLMGDTSYYTEYSRERGTAVHSAIEMLEQNDLDEATVDPVIVPYIEAWKAFKKETGYKSETQEQIVYNPTYQFAGTLDQTGFIGKHTCILDIKTGAHQRWWALQTWAYNSVAKRQKRLSVELKPDGKYRMTEHTDKRDLQRFLACLTIAGTKQAWGIK